MKDSRRWLAAAALLFCAGAGACRSSPPTPSPSAPPPSFRADVEPVLARFCASAEGCHGDHPTHSVRLDLRPGHAHRDLVLAPAKTRTGAIRVVPGDPSRSYLLDKLRGTLATGEGKAMPLDAETGAPLEANPLPAGLVEHALQGWIARGAPAD